MVCEMVDYVSEKVGGMCERMDGVWHSILRVRKRGWCERVLLHVRESGWCVRWWIASVRKWVV